MLQLTGEARFADLIERTLYNAMLPSLSLDGESYFYQNPLADGGKHLAKRNVAPCPRHTQPRTSRRDRARGHDYDLDPVLPQLRHLRRQRFQVLEVKLRGAASQQVGAEFDDYAFIALLHVQANLITTPGAAPAFRPGPVRSMQPRPADRSEGYLTPPPTCGAAGRGRG